MLKQLFAVLTFCSLSALAGPPNGIEGRWLAELTPPGRNQAGAQPAAIPAELNLKSKGNEVEGTLSVVRGRKQRRRTSHIESGSFDGTKFSFVTVQKTRKRGDVRFRWEGTLTGDRLEGARTRDGASRSVPFTARRG